MSKFLIQPPNPNKITTKHVKSSGCVLTSQESLALLQQKEKNKVEAAYKKEVKRREREERKQEKLQQKLKCMLKASVFYSKVLLLFVHT